MELGVAYLISAIITAIGGGLTLISNNRQNKRNIAAQQHANEQNIAAQKEVNQQNIENSWEMWHATNAYNTPAAQMDRYKEAGLNPNLIYGQSNATSAVSIPSMQAPEVSPVMSNFDINQMESYLNKISEMPFLKYQIDKMKSDAKIAEREADIKNMERDIKTDQWIESSVKGRMWQELRNNHELFETYFQAWFNSELSRFQSPELENAYKRSITSVQGVIKAIKDIDLSKLNDMYELRMEAMRIANEINQIELDWEQFDKALSASSGVVRTIMSMVKYLIK